MVKSRMNSADVAAEVACLRRLIGYRLANVYDLNPKVPLCKKERKKERKKKKDYSPHALDHLIGSRCHLVQCASGFSSIRENFV